MNKISESSPSTSQNQHLLKIFLEKTGQNFLVISLTQNDLYSGTVKTTEQVFRETLITKIPSHVQSFIKQADPKLVSLNFTCSSQNYPYSFDVNSASSLAKQLNEINKEIKKNYKKIEYSRTTIEKLGHHANCYWGTTWPVRFGDDSTMIISTQATLHLDWRAKLKKQLDFHLELKKQGFSYLSLLNNVICLDPKPYPGRNYESLKKNSYLKKWPLEELLIAKDALQEKEEQLDYKLTLHYKNLIQIGYNAQKAKNICLRAREEIFLYGSSCGRFSPTTDCVSSSHIHWYQHNDIWKIDNLTFKSVYLFFENNRRFSSDNYTLLCPFENNSSFYSFDLSSLDCFMLLGSKQELQPFEHKYANHIYYMEDLTDELKLLLKIPQNPTF